VLNKIANFLSVPAFSENAFSKGIVDQEGQLWQGNSSHDAASSGVSIIDQAKIGSFRKHLHEDMIAYIEYTCRPEMNFLKYQMETDAPNLTVNVLHNFSEQFAVEAHDLAPDFSTQPQHIRDEVERLKIYDQALAGITDTAASLYYLDKIVLTNLITATRGTVR
jgi:hypothetical protein